MRTLSVETLVFSAAALAAMLLLGPLALTVPISLQLGLLLAAVVFLGLPHGALDPWIARHAGFSRGPMGLPVFSLVYLGLAGLVVLGWWASPVLALGLFLLLSAWHFAGDWQGQLKPWQRGVAATALLSMPATFHPTLVEPIFIALSGEKAVPVAQGLRVLGHGAVVGLLIVMGMALVQRRYGVLIELGLLLLLALSVPPLIYFTVYFCLLHSPRHLRATLRQAEPQARTGLLVSAAAYTLITVVIAAVVAVFLMPGGNLSQLVLQLVFIGLAALTVPHMLLIVLVRSRRRSLESNSPVKH